MAEIHDNLYFTGIIRDNTENQELEDRVLQTERLAAVGNTVTHIAHEIKNPLLVIGGFARQLLRVPGLDDKARRKLTIMAEEVSNLEKLVAEEYATLSAARQPLNNGAGWRRRSRRPWRCFRTPSARTASR